MLTPSATLLNGTLIQCDSIPTIYPCVAPGYACWNSSSNCFGLIFNTSSLEAGVLPSGYCNVTICPLDTYNQAYYDYIPTLGGNALFAAIFGLLLILQVIFAIRWKTWSFFIGMCGGLTLEVIGYIGRILISNQPFAKNPFLIYLICLTIGPAFLSASIYLCLSHIVVVYGEHMSRFKPWAYTITFITCDFISLLLQAIGGALASTADTQANLDTGTHIMVAGLSFQVASLLLFMSLCTDLALRVRKGVPSQTNFSIHDSRVFHYFLYALAASTVCIFVRSVFRVAELSKGFHGPLDNQEVTYMILEGVMIIFASLALTVFHPGWAFGGKWASVSFHSGKRRQGEENNGSSLDPSNEVGEKGAQVTVTGA